MRQRPSKSVADGVAAGATDSGGNEVRRGTEVEVRAGGLWGIVLNQVIGKEAGEKPAMGKSRAFS